MPHNFHIQAQKKSMKMRWHCSYPKDTALVVIPLAAAIADGLSSAEGGRIAAETSVTNFINDFFATPE
jgi:TRAP-type mannitol/chloroaromatic compound transport system substrate-binding protein